MSKLNQIVSIKKSVDRCIDILDRLTLKFNPNHGPDGRFAPGGGGGGSSSSGSNSGSSSSSSSGSSGGSSGSRSNENESEDGISMDEASKLLDMIHKHGGFTYQPVTKNVPDKGFVVSIYPQYEKKIKADAAKPEDIKEYSKKHMDEFRKDHNKHMGGWHDTEKGNIVLDVVVVLDSEAKARELGVKHNQDAIYDIGGEREIRLKSVVSGSVVKATKNSKIRLMIFPRMEPDENGEYTDDIIQKHSEMVAALIRKEAKKDKDAE